MDILAEVIGELAHLTEAELYSLLQLLRALRRNSRLEYENDALKYRQRRRVVSVYRFFLSFSVHKQKSPFFLQNRAASVSRPGAVLFFGYGNTARCCRGCGGAPEHQSHRIAAYRAVTDRRYR